MNIRYQFFGIFAFLILVMFSACQSTGVNKTGSEYMPDMGHSVAYEANSYGYYSHNRWGTEQELHDMVQPRQPIGGTIPRGYAGHDTEGRGIQYKKNGAVPYYYADTEEERTRAIAEIKSSPFPISKSGLEKGKALYNINCAICHGEKGDGAGYLVREDGGKYPVQPANFMTDDLINSSNGRYYHSIIYGKNLMGGYSDKLSYEERWNVIQYIRSLQAATKNLKYDETTNTLNTVDTPYAVLQAKKVAETVVAEKVDAKDAEMHKEATTTKESHSKGDHH